MVTITTLSERPELAPIVAAWRVAAFFDYPGGYTVPSMTAALLEPPTGPRETFVLFDRNRPVGTAGITHADLESRPDLTPWLVGVFVEPAFRRRGFASALIRRAEAFADAAAVPCLWLYTVDAETLYARLGWERVGTEPDRGKSVVLMRRPMPPPPRT